MTEVPFALSISHFVNSVGADAGFAAIIGLAILILLYFAQARETATLRDQAESAAEHVQQLEYRISQLQRGSGGAPAAAPAPAVRPGVPAAPAPARAAAAAAAPPASRTVPPERSALPIAPAGLGAPALASATRLIPAGEDDLRVHASPAREAALVGAAAGASTVAARASGSGGAAPSAGAGSAVADRPGPAPSTPAGGANGGSRPPAPVGAAAAPAAARPSGPPTSAQSRPGTLPPRNGGGRPVASPPRRTPPPERPGLRSALLVVGGLLAVAVVVVALLALTSSGSSTPQSSSSTSPLTNAPSGKKHHKAKARTVSTLKPASVTVAVLNGTSTTNLAHDISQKLASDGYKQGAIATATDQTQSATVVGYLPGQRPAAVIVAHSLGLGGSSIQAVTQANQAVACPSAGACPAQVIVTVGSDLASAAASASQSSAANSTTG